MFTHSSKAVAWALISYLGIWVIPTRVSAQAADCTVAVALILDKSASMVQGDAPFTPLRRALRDSITAVPSGLWFMGLGTFPEYDAPKWPIPAGSTLDGVALVTDANRPELLQVLNSLVANGLWSPLASGLQLGALMVQDDDYAGAHRYVVVATDGLGCFSMDCSDVRLAADFVKAQGIHIVAVGYGLEGTERNLMRDVASALPDGSKDFFNSTSADDLYSNLRSKVDTLCTRNTLTLRVPQRLRGIARGGTATGDFLVRHESGPPVTINMLLNTAGFGISWGSVTFPSSLAPSPPAARTLSGKLTYQVMNSAPLGPRNVWVQARNVTSNDIVAARVVDVEVIDLTFTISAVGTISATAQPKVYRGSIETRSTSSVSVPGTLSYIIYPQGSRDPASGFTFLGSPSSLVIENSGSSVVRTTIPFTFRRDSAAAGLYDVHVVLTAAGLSKRHIFGGVTL